MLHKLRRLVIHLSKRVLRIVPKNKRLVLFTAWFGKKYADNSMYVFEYMLHHIKEYRCVWYATDKVLYEELEGLGIPVVYSKSLKGKWAQLRATILVGSIDLSEYNPYLLVNCIYINLGHGHTIKHPGAVISDTKSKNFYLLLREKIEIVTVVCAEKTPFSNGDSIVDKELGNQGSIVLGFARNDLFYDASLRVGKNKSVSKVIDNKIVISYLPTHRSDGNEQIIIDKLFDLKELDDICEEYNAVFIVKKHFYHRFEKTDLLQYNNIYDFSRDLSIETQALLYQTDILVSDYSACFIDYLLLNRPIILYQYDYCEFKERERDFLVPFEKIKISSYPKNSKDFSAELRRILENHLQDGFEEGRKMLKNEYFSKGISHHVREDVANYIVERIVEK